MKKLFLSLVVLGAQVVFGQEKAKNESNFGIKGGVNHTTVTQGDFDEGPDPRTSFHIGFFTEVSIISNFLSIQPEIIYSRQGFENNFSLLGNNYKTIYKIDYINVPVLAKIHIGQVLAFEGGPQFGLKINETVNTNNDTVETNDVNSYDTALAAGISLNVDSFFLYGRYTYSLNEVVENSDAKNSVIQVGIGLKF